jgi:hypothetical protein
LHVPADWRHNSPKSPARHQDEILLSRPLRLPGHPTRDLEKAVRVVGYRKGGVVLDREQPVWDADEHAGSDPAKLAHEEALILRAADVLENGIRGRYIETAVIERKTDIRLDPHIADGGKGDLKFSALPKPASGDLVRMRVASLQEIRSGIHYIRYANIENPVRRRRSYSRLEISENLIAGGDKKPLG